MRATKEQWWRRRFQKRANPPPLLHLHLDGNDDDYDDDGDDGDDNDCQFGGASFSKVPSLENSDSKSGDQSMLLLFVLKMCSMYLTHCNALKTKFKKAIS